MMQGLIQNWQIEPILTPFWVSLNLAFFEKILGFANIVIDNLFYLITWARWAFSAKWQKAQHAQVRRDNKPF